MQTCKTCRYWGAMYEGSCDKVDTIISDINKRFEIKVWVADDHGLDTQLRTGSEFGCIHHEIKKKK